MSTVSGQVVAMPERAAALPPSVSSRRPQSKLVRFDPRVLERVRVCRRIDELVDGGYSLSHAIGQLRGRDASLPSAGTLRRLHAAWIAGGVVALMDRRRGRQRKPYGWEVRAVELYNSPTRPAMATVAYWLRGEGYPGATNSRVRRYFGSLPAAVAGENSPKRAGWHYYKQNIGPYVRRDRRVIEVGLIYEGDGHLSDVFVRHPASGGHYRPELTIWIDIRSGYVTGFGLSDAESAVSTLHSLCHALKSEDHVPAALHVDPGSGFINRLLTDESLGWLRRLGIDIITEEPGNAKGKGLIEGWFRWFEERVGKRFSSYCGHCRTDDDIRRLKNSIRDKRVKLPSLPQYAEAIKEYIAAYNHTPQPNLGCAPADIWASLERNPVGIPPEALPRPSEERVARRGAVEFYNRVYRAPELLLLLDGRRVEVEYDFFDDSRVWINHDGQRVCVAKLAERRRWAEESRIADLKAKRKRGQEKRLLRGLREIEAQARPVIDAEAHAHAAEIAAEIVAPEEPEPEGKDDFVDYL